MKWKKIVLGNFRYSMCFPVDSVLNSVVLDLTPVILDLLPVILVLITVALDLLPVKLKPKYKGFFRGFPHVRKNIVVLLNFSFFRDFRPFFSGFRSSCSEMRTYVKVFLKGFQYEIEKISSFLGILDLFPCIFL